MTSGQASVAPGSAAPVQAPGLQVEHASMQFQSRGTVTDVFDDVSFDVKSGEFVSIVGPSGCGKTTVLRIVGGLIAPTTGRVVIGERQVTKPGPDRGFVFQQDSLFPWRTLVDNVRFGLEVQHMKKHASIHRAMEMLELVGLVDFAQHYPHELSGGMRQRANLARALAIGPDVLLMDEPFSALDAQTREFMQEELLQIWRREKRTVLFITHQIDEAVYLSDRVIVMGARPGRIRDVVSIGIPRPRDLRVKRTPEFLRYTDLIWRQIEEEARLDARLGMA
ncbi:MAG TPA: ABC transporter ATP-binding protein [Gaiellaceae bacterium]